MGLRPVLNTHVPPVTSSKAWNFSYTSSLPFVLWPHRLSKASLLSLRQCNRLTIVHVRTSETVFVKLVKLVTYVQSAHHVFVASSIHRSFAGVYHISAPAELLEAPPVFADSCGVSSFCGFSALTGLSVSPVQIVFEPLRVHKIILHQCGDPGSTFLRVRLSNHQATPAAQRRSKFRHHLLRDVNASAVLFVPGSRRCRCRFGRNLQVHHRKISGRRSRSGLTFRPATSKDFGVFPTAFHGSSVARHHRCKEGAIFASSISKFGTRRPPVDCDVLRSSTDPTISTSVIHNTASEE